MGWNKQLQDELDRYSAWGDEQIKLLRLEKIERALKKAEKINFPCSPVNPIYNQGWRDAIGYVKKQIETENKETNKKRGLNVV